MDNKSPEDVEKELANAAWFPILSSTYSDLVHLDDARGIVLDIQSSLTSDEPQFSKHEMPRMLESVLDAIGDAGGEIIRLCKIASSGGYDWNQRNNLQECDVQAWATQAELEDLV